MNELSSRLWHILTNPSDDLTDIEHRQQTQILSILLLLLIVTALPGLLIKSDYTAFIPGVLVGACVAYGLSRTRYVSAAVLTGLITLTLPPFIKLINETAYTPEYVAYDLNWLVLPVLVCSLVLSFKSTLIYTLILSGTAFVLAIILNDLTIAQVFEGGATLWSASILILLGQRVRQHYIARFRIANRLLTEQSVALKRTQHALQTSEDRLRGFFDHAPVALWEEDFSAVKMYIDDLRVEGVTNFRAYFESHPDAAHHCASLVNIVDVNETSLVTFRASGREEMLQSLADFFVDESYDVFQEELIALANHETRFTCEIMGQPVTGDPINCRVDLSIAPGAEADWSKVFVSVQDITERIQTQKALRQSEERYRTLVEFSPEAIVVYQKGTITYINPAGVELFEAATPDAIIGLPVERLVHPDSGRLVKSQAEYIMQSGDQKVPFVERQLLRLNGDAFWAEVSVRPIIYEGNMSDQMIIHDITARKEAEQREKDLIIEREKIRALSEFINDISHDFRTPLTVINTHIYLLTKRLSDEDHLKRLNLMAKHSDRLMHMVDDMFDMFELDLRGGDLPMMSVNLTPLLRTVTADYPAMAARKNQTFNVEVPDTPQLVWGHANSLGRVVVNMVVNAFQFTDEGDTITLRSSVNDRHVMIEVIDTGIGINPKDLPHIFKRFYRANKTRPTESGGTGLGLTIAKRIVERHQGRIEVQSVEHEGSTFRVILPRYSRGAKEAE